MILLFTLTGFKICIDLYRPLIYTQRCVQTLFLRRFTFGTLLASLKLLYIIMFTSVCGKLNFNFTCIRLSYFHNCFTLFFMFDCFKFTCLLLNFSTFISNLFILLDHRVTTVTFQNLIVVRHRFYIQLFGLLYDFLAIIYRIMSSSTYTHLI